jgi:hypothetical protein
MKIKPWMKTMAVAVIGGGVTGTVAAIIDHKYNVPEDIGSGKLWEFFITGAITSGLATLVESPIKK